MGVSQGKDKRMKKTTMMCLLMLAVTIDTFWNGYPSLAKAAGEIILLICLAVGAVVEIANDR